ncbi:hypothetical protein Vretifemale_1625 [Volvox reticuliferus]|uniref:Uncharacterized protein n=1 Tax=Volvox reticuliferus TaxID=1737510 RepID=A0A8J4BXF6_9CHLO|nr:hypothetical protein Vretifemale_1625 [Volvox reticuliferus]
MCNKEIEKCSRWANDAEMRKEWNKTASHISPNLLHSHHCCTVSAFRLNSMVMAEEAAGWMAAALVVVVAEEKVAGVAVEEEAGGRWEQWLLWLWQRDIYNYPLSCAVAQPSQGPWCASLQAKLHIV